MRFTREDYHKISELELFDPNKHVELIFGEIIQRSPKGVAHETCLRILLRQFFTILPQSFVIGCQSPVAIGESSEPEPEPDVSIASGCEADYADRHPTGHDVLLAIEVSDSTLRFDKTTKASLYAEANIPNYWIFNLVESCLEAYCNPARKEDGTWHYLEIQIYTPSDQIALPLVEERDGQPNRLDLCKIPM
jgi:Uma2 family endonuclease